MAKRKTLRSSFEENYTPVVVPADNKRGEKIEYVYYGPWYVWDVSEAEFKKKKILIAALEIVSLLIFIAAASIYDPLNMLHVAFAFTAAAECFHIMELAALVDFLTAKIRTNKLKYQNVSRGFEFFTMLRAMLFAAATFTGILYVIFGNFTLEACIISLSYALCGGMAWYTKKTYKEMEFYTEENDILKKLGIVPDNKDNNKGKDKK